MKRIITFVAAMAIALAATAQSPQTGVTFRVKAIHDRLFVKGEQAQVSVVAVNMTGSKLNDQMVLTLMTDTRDEVDSYTQKVSIGARDSVELNFIFKIKKAGFYRCRVQSTQTGAFELFNIGFDPENIVSKPDGQRDLKKFWDTARADLKKVDPKYEIIPLPQNSGPRRNLYLVKFYSLGGVQIQGYFAVPTSAGKHPAIISYMGYGSKPWIPNADGNPDYVEFVLSVRGQALNEGGNIYGDWIRYNLNDPSSYYYRGAFMDVVRAIDFVCSRPEVDSRYVFADGASQGGAFTIVAAALDSRITAAAPAVPFLSDYPDYFRIVNWPADALFARQRELGMSNQELYRNLSYFDIKNIASWITCPVIMGFGLQDEVCPPHTNFAAYNQIKSRKQYICYPLAGHSLPGDDWWNAKMKFFESFWK